VIALKLFLWIVAGGSTALFIFLVAILDFPGLSAIASFAIPAFPALFLVLAMLGLARRDWAAAALVSILSTGFSFFAADIALQYGQWFGEGGQCMACDKRDFMQVVIKERAEGREAEYPTALRGDGPRGTFADGMFTLSGTPSARTVMCNELGFWVIYQGDEHGFNNDLGLWRPDDVNFAVVGDSFAHGGCVEREDNISTGLMRQLGRGLNLGQGGTGPGEYLGVIVEYAKPVRPKKVFVTFYEGNDLDEFVINPRAPSRFVDRYLVPGFAQGLIERTDMVRKHQVETFAAQVNARVSNMSANSNHDEDTQLTILLREAFLLRTLRTTFSAAIRPPRPYDWEKFERVFARMKEEVEGWGGEIWFVHLPDWRTDASWTKAGARDYRQTLEAIRRVGIPIIDGYQGFSGHPQPGSLYSGPGLHYNQLGYAYVAELILEALGRPR